MYEKGLLKIVDPPCEDYDYADGFCFLESSEDHIHSITDARSKEPNKDLINVVYLPHSCQYWVIGGKREVLLMIEDLKEILKKIEEL